MKKLIVWSLFLLVFTTLPAAAKEAVATVASIQNVEDSNNPKSLDDPNVAKSLAIIRGGKAGVLSENDSLEAGDIVDTANKTVSLKTQNGSVWKLDEKTKFSVHSSSKDGKPVYVFFGGHAEYRAAEKAGEIVVKINDKDYLLSAGANVNFSRGVDVTSVTILIGTVTFGKQVFNKTISIDAQGNVNLPPAGKTRGIRG